MRASARVMQENVSIVSAIAQRKKADQSQTRFPFFCGVCAADLADDRSIAKDRNAGAKAIAPLAKGFES
jgi:hypothetical protein